MLRLHNLYIGSHTFKNVRRKKLHRDEILNLIFFKLVFIKHLFKRVGIL